MISRQTQGRIESLAGFRNVLVHKYAEVDRGKVHAALGRLDDFEAFAADVEGWLARTGR